MKRPKSVTAEEWKSMDKDMKRTFILLGELRRLTKDLHKELYDAKITQTPGKRNKK